MKENRNSLKQLVVIKYVMNALNNCLEIININVVQFVENKIGLNIMSKYTIVQKMKYGGDVLLFYYFNYIYINSLSYIYSIKLYFYLFKFISIFTLLL